MRADQPPRAPVAKWLTRWSAKPVFEGSIPSRCSIPLAVHSVRASRQGSTRTGPGLDQARTRPGLDQNWTTGLDQNWTRTSPSLERSRYCLHLQRHRHFDRRLMPPPVTTVQGALHGDPTDRDSSVRSGSGSDTASAITALQGSLSEQLPASTRPYADASVKGVNPGRCLAVAARHGNAGAKREC